MSSCAEIGGQTQGCKGHAQSKGGGREGLAHAHTHSHAPAATKHTVVKAAATHARAALHTQTNAGGGRYGKMEVFICGSSTGKTSQRLSRLWLKEFSSTNTASRKSYFTINSAMLFSSSKITGIKYSQFDVPFFMQKMNCIYL